MDAENNILIRLANDNDFEAILNIWLIGIQKTFANFPKPENLKDLFKDNFVKRNSAFNFWVAEDEKMIMGWCSITSLTSNPLKKNLWAEVSTYIHSQHKDNGLGSMLMKYVFNQLKNTSIQFVFGFADKLNTKSIQMCYNAGMKSHGTTPKPSPPPNIMKK